MRKDMQTVSSLFHGVISVTLDFPLCLQRPQTLWQHSCSRNSDLNIEDCFLPADKTCFSNCNISNNYDFGNIEADNRKSKTLIVILYNNQRA